MEENNYKKSETKPKAYEPLAQLRVAEGLGKDVGKGLARLDPKDLEKLGIQVGDIIQIEGLTINAVILKTGLLDIY